MGELPYGGDRDFAEAAIRHKRKRQAGGLVMAASTNKTVATPVDAADWIAALDPPRRAQEGEVLQRLFEMVSGEPVRMWGPSIVGFGAYHYRYESGREGDMCRIGFSPRKGQHVLYLHCDGSEQGEDAALLSALGKHKTNGGCIYVSKLADIDMAALEALVRHAWQRMALKYPS
jgi:Domain of unknown function (DU1801)